MTYVNILNNYYTAGAYTYDSAAKAPSLSYPGGEGTQQCTWITYEDPTSVAAKGAYATAMGLGGTIIWTINEGYDAVKGTNDLLTATRASFP